jgi:hypothetical protein
MPSGIAFLDGGTEGRRYRELTHAYEEIMAVLPAVHGFRIRTMPVELNAIGQMRFDAAELDELSVQIATEEEIVRPGTELDEYRLRLDQARRELIRERLSGLTTRIDDLLRDLSSRIPVDPEQVNREQISDPKWRT